MSILETLSSNAYWAGEHSAHLDPQLAYGKTIGERQVVAAVRTTYYEATDRATVFPLEDGTPLSSAPDIIHRDLNNREWLIGVVEDTREQGWARLMLRGLHPGYYRSGPATFEEKAQQLAEKLHIDNPARIRITADEGERYALTRQLVFYLGSTAMHPGTMNGRPVISGLPAASLLRHPSALSLAAQDVQLPANLVVGKAYASKAGNLRQRVVRAVVILPTGHRIVHRSKQSESSRQNSIPAIVPAPSI